MPEEQKVSDLQKRRGKMRIDKALLFTDPTEQSLRLLFSNFFPFGIQTELEHGDSFLFYYGYSPYFRTVEVSEKSPEYVAHFVLDGEVTKLDKMVEVKYSM